MEIGLDKENIGGRIETADGTHVYLFRYDNPSAQNRNPNSEVSSDELVGRWFTDLPESLTTRILMRPPGGNIVVVEAPKDRLEELRAANNPIAKGMDIERDNFIVPDALMAGMQTFSVTVPNKNPRKYMLKDAEAIRSFMDNLVTTLKQQII